MHKGKSYGNRLSWKMIALKNKTPPLFFEKNPKIHHAIVSLITRYSAEQRGFFARKNGRHVTHWWVESRTKKDFDLTPPTKNTERNQI